MELLLKKHFFKWSPIMMTFFLLMMTDSLSAQKKNLKIKPPDYIKLRYAGVLALFHSGPAIIAKIKH